MKLATAAIIILPLSGCVTNTAPNQYRASQVGSVNRAVQGTVLSARAVSVDTSTGAGGVAGAGAGGAIGAAIGDGGSDLVVGAVAGAIIGGLVGAAIEKRNAIKDAREYVVQTSNGALLTVVQAGEPIAEGAKVIVLYGSPARIIIDNSTSQLERP